MGPMFRDFLSKTDPFGRHVPVKRFYGSTPPGLKAEFNITNISRKKKVPVFRILKTSKTGTVP